MNNNVDYSWLNKGRYIFFSNFKKGWYGHDTIGRYQGSKILEIGESRLPKEFTPAKDIEHTDINIQSYVRGLKEIYQKMVTSEVTFLNKNKEKIDQSLGAESSIAKIISNLNSNKGITEDEYTDLITFFNALKYNDIDELNTNLKQAHDRISALKTAFDQLKPEKKPKAAKEYIEGTYSSSTREMLKRRINKNTNGVDQILQSETTKLANILNEIFTNLHYNTVFIDFLKSKCAENPNETTINISGTDLSDIIIAAISQTVYNHRKESIQNIENSVNDLIEQLIHDPNILSDLAKKADAGDLAFFDTVSQSYEKLIHRQEVEKLFEYIKRNEQKSKEFFANLGLNDDEIKHRLGTTWDEIMTSCDNLRSQTNIFNQFCQEAKQLLNNKIDEYIKSNKLNGLKPGEQLRRFFKNNSTFNINDNETDIEKKLGNFAKNIKISLTKSDYAEKITGEKSKELAEHVMLQKPGKVIQLKDDIFYILHTSSMDFQLLAKHLITDKETNMKKTLNDKVEEIIESTLGSFLTQYNKKGRGSTDIAKAKETYKELYDKCIEQLTNLKKDYDIGKEELELIWKKLKETTMGSDSVKDYMWYNDELGYHGGSLGGSGSPEKVLQNIEDMYQSGGISFIDKEKLLFAILNCADAAIGAKLKISLENYLLGGAALIMFDESFAYGSQYIESLQQTVSAQYDPQHLTLYFLDLTYIPGSYVLKNIIDTIEQFYTTELSAQIDKVNKQRNSVHIINPAQWQPFYAKDFKLQLTQASNNAMNNIIIKYMFMAGMLDIIERIQERMTKIS